MPYNTLRNLQSAKFTFKHELSISDSLLLFYTIRDNELEVQYLLCNIRQ